LIFGLVKTLLVLWTHQEVIAASSAQQPKIGDIG
jgi:hypothetical protein